MAPHVLFVEDSPGDVRLTREAFYVANETIAVHVAADGVEAMAFLNHEGAFADVPRPDLVLLDLNLPRKNGWEVLAAIKRDTGLMSIPTIILTASEADDDVEKSFQLNANVYFSKPVELDAFEQLIASITQFWLTTAQLPPHRYAG